jgi:nucleotide-binding universal stress UspA family protein
MTKLLVCVDSSVCADNITTHAAWVANRLNAEIDLLHVVRHHSEYDAPSSDHTGAIGIEASSDLMESLIKVDQARGKRDQQEGRRILDYAEDALKKAGVEKINPLHRRGSLSDTIRELENDADIIFIGKSSDQNNPDSEFLGLDPEKMARSIHKPIFLVSRYLRPIHKFLIAYDGKDNANKTVDFICHSALLKGLECHLITVGKEYQSEKDDAVEKLNKAGYTVITGQQTSGHVEQVIQSYVESAEIDLLLMGAYSHSRMRTMLLGSTTEKLTKSCHVPVMLFR